MNRSKRIGNAAEELARNRLRSHGLVMVEKVGTPVKVFPAKRHAGLFKVVWEEKVSCDVRAIVPGTGRAVYAEVKHTTGEDRLIHSRLETHQVDALNLAHYVGAIALLIWTNEWGVHIMRWPIDGFKKGTSISLEQAQGLHWRLEHERN